MKFKIKPYEESIGLSHMVNLYNSMAKYINPETLLEITEEMVHIVLGKDTILSRDFLIFENEKAEIVGFAGLSKMPTYKEEVEIALYSILPEYFDSELPGIVIDAILELGMKKKPPELLFQVVGDLSAPFQKKLELLGFEPIHYTWSMYLDDFDLFVNPGIPPNIKIVIQNEIEDYSVVIDVINAAFDGSFKFKPITERTWRKLQRALQKDHIVQYCMAYKEDIMVGLCDIYMNPKMKHIGHVADLSVPPNEQHQKIGSTMLACGIDKLREKGCKAIHLDVHAENEKALGLYKKYGFHPKNNLTEKIYQLL